MSNAVRGRRAGYVGKFRDVDHAIMGGVAVLVTFPFLKTPLTFDLDHYLQPTQLALKGKVFCLDQT
jgi:hypothetical protein